jgi:hypothetical protein
MYKAGVGEFTVPGSQTINSLSVGTDSDGTQRLLINTSSGIRYSDGQTYASRLTGINNITGSGTFVNETAYPVEVVVYYQRLGGLGGDPPRASAHF